MNFTRVDQIVQWRLCIGCGACKAVCPEKNITLVDAIHEGIRPMIKSADCRKCGTCVAVCPGIGIDQSGPHPPGILTDLLPGWGPILEIWEGYAADPQLRHKGSSGGAASALSLYCIERGGMHGVIHTGFDPADPLKNSTRLSRTREDILSGTGSRYLPASPCDGLDKLEGMPLPCAFVGKPCDVSAVRKSQAIKPKMSNAIGVAIGIFCAGTPATQGTIDLLKKAGVNPGRVENIRYRGEGWPGYFSVRFKDGREEQIRMTYMEAWGFIQRYRPYRCYLCPDGTSEFADVSCGDPWYREIQEGEQGYSLILVRTEKGRKLVHDAMQAGYLVLKEAPQGILEASQKNLLGKRGAIWGRLLSMKMFMIPAPGLHGFSLFINWLKIPAYDKLRSVGGTARRIIQRGYYKRTEAG